MSLDLLTEFSDQWRNMDPGDEPPFIFCKHKKPAGWYERQWNSPPTLNTRFEALELKLHRLNETLQRCQSAIDSDREVPQWLKRRPEEGGQGRQEDDNHLPAEQTEPPEPAEAETTPILSPLRPQVFLTCYQPTEHTKLQGDCMVETVKGETQLFLKPPHEHTLFPTRWDNDIKGTPGTGSGILLAVQASLPCHLESLLQLGPPHQHQNSKIGRRFSHLRSSEMSHYSFIPMRPLHYSRKKIGCWYGTMSGETALNKLGRHAHFPWDPGGEGQHGFSLIGAGDKLHLRGMDLIQPSQVSTHRLSMLRRAR